MAVLLTLLGIASLLWPTSAQFRGRNDVRSDLPQVFSDGVSLPFVVGVPPFVTTAKTAAVEPIPYFYVTWTAIATGFSDTSPSPGYRIVKNRRIVMVLECYALQKFWSS